MCTVMGWLRLVGSLKLQVSFAKEPYKRNDILQKRPIILRSLLIVATPYKLMSRTGLFLVDCGACRYYMCNSACSYYMCNSACR